MSVNETRPSDRQSPQGISKSLLRLAAISILVIWPRTFIMAPLGRADIHFTDGRFSASAIELGLMAFSLILCAVAVGMWLGVRDRR
ncbi:MAG: hypothetical protein JWR84_3226 [Caulobacter sp.]|nr:hypothetical protein [Caulobacter sp.]